MGMQVICMCIDDWQLDVSHFPGLVDCINCPLIDDAHNGFRAGDVERATEAAKKVADHVRAGRNAYVQCHAGQNRSGLVNGLAIMMLSGCSGAEAVAIIQSRRKEALWNPFTAAYLRGLENQWR